MKVPLSLVAAPLLALGMATFTLASLVAAGAIFLKPVLWVAVLLGFIYLFPCIFLALFDQTENDLRECATELGARWSGKGRDPRLKYFYIIFASVSLLSALASCGSAFHAQYLCHTSGCTTAKMVMPVLSALPLLLSGTQHILMRKKHSVASRISLASFYIFLLGSAISTLPLFI